MIEMLSVLLLFLNNNELKVNVKTFSSLGIEMIKLLSLMLKEKCNL